MAGQWAGNDVRVRVYGVGIPLRSSVGLLGSASPFAERKGRFLGCARDDGVRGLG